MYLLVVLTSRKHVHNRVSRPCLGRVPRRDFQEGAGLVTVTDRPIRDGDVMIPFKCGVDPG